MTRGQRAIDPSPWLVLLLLYRARLKVFSFYLWGFAAAVASGLLDLAK